MEDQHDRPVVTMAIYQPPAPAGPMLITGGEDGVAKVWDLFTLRLMSVCTAHTKKILALAVHADSGLAVSGGDDLRILVWDPRSGKIEHTLNAKGDTHEKSISCLALVDPTPKPTIIVAGSYDKALSVWDMKSGELHFRIDTGHTDLLLSVSVLHEYDRGFEGVTLITGSWDKKIRVFPKWGSGESFLLQEHTKSVMCVVAHCARVKEKTLPLLVSGSLDKTCIVWDVHAREKIRSLVGHTAKVTCVRVFARDAFEDGLPPLVLSSSEDKLTLVWDLLSGERLRAFTHNAAVNVHEVYSASPCGLLLVTGDTQNTITAWNTLRTERTQRMYTKAVTAIDVYHPRTQGETFRHPIVCIGSIDSTISLFEVVTYPCGKTKSKELPEKKLVGHKSRINGLVIYSPADIREPPLLISCAGDASIKVWNLLTSKMVRELEGHKIVVFSVALYDPVRCGLMNVGEEEMSETTLSSALAAQTEQKEREKEKESVFKCSNASVREADNVSVSLPRPPSDADVHTPKEKDKATCTSKNGVELDLSRPLVITGGLDRDVRVWDFLSSAEDCCVGILPKIHTNFVRSIAVLHTTTHSLTYKRAAESTSLSHSYSQKHLHPSYLQPQSARTNDHFMESEREAALFVTGSYDMTAKLWDLRKCELLRTFSGLHTGFVFTVQLYDPYAFMHKLKHTRRSRDDQEEESTEAALLVTAGYDGITGVWDLSTGKVVRELRGHKDSVTALALYTPPYSPHAQTQTPLVVTGSIDRIVIVWSLLTGERLQTLVGHSDRVCYLATTNAPLPQNPPSQEEDAPSAVTNATDTQSTRYVPWLFSGGDDNVTILWEDALHTQTYMPLRDAVNRAFDSDVDGENWPLITDMTLTYGTQVFAENAHLFYLAIRRNRSDFLLKFREYLTYSLCQLGGDRSILNLSMERNDIVAVRAILLSWTEALNRDVENSFDQSCFHAMHFFRSEDLHALGTSFPSELVIFISSLRPIRNHLTALDYLSVEMKGDVMKQNHQDGERWHKARIDTPDHKLLSGANDPAAYFHEVWEAAFIRERSSLFTRVFPRISFPFSFPISSNVRSKRELGRGAQEQPVTSLMLPLQDCSSLEMIDLFLRVSLSLDSFDLFDCPIGEFSLRLYWEQEGHVLHIQSLLQFVLTLLVFGLCLFAYDSPNISDVEIAVVNSVMIAMFAVYLVEEVRQCRADYCGQFSHNAKFNSTKDYDDTFIAKMRDKPVVHAREHRDTVIYFALKHVLLDFWNMVDIALCVTGILGIAMRFWYHYDSDTGSNLLAVTSVLMWLKTLYFMRPFSSSGQFVAAIVRIIYDVRFFVVTFGFVLLGFAQAFWVLSRKDKIGSFGTVGDALYSAFLTMLGSLTPEFQGTASPNFATLLLCIFMMVQIVLLLNVLIGFMGESLSDARNLGDALWRRERAKVVCEQAFKRGLNNSHLSKYVFILQYTSDVRAATDKQEESPLVELVAKGKKAVFPFTDLEEERAALAAKSEKNDSASNKGTGEGMVIITEAQLNELIRKAAISFAKKEGSDV